AGAAGSARGRAWGAAPAHALPGPGPGAHGRPVRSRRGPSAPDRNWCPRQDSNLRTRLRRPVLYPLSYEGGLIQLTVAAYNGLPVPGTTPWDLERTEPSGPELAGERGADARPPPKMLSGTRRLLKRAPVRAG